MSPKKTAIAAADNDLIARLRKLDRNEIKEAILARYVDGDALAKRVHAAGRSMDDDKEFAILVHQAQTKFYADPAMHDGSATPTFLASLGYLVYGSGGYRGLPIRSLKKAQAVAQSEFGAQSARLESALPGFRPHAWHAWMVNPSFLGFAFDEDVHALLVRRLRDAEAHLRRNPAYRDVSPAALGMKLGLRANHGVDRASALRPFGLSFDLDCKGAPFILGDPASSAASHARFTRMIERATFLVEGSAVRLDAQHLGSIGRAHAASTDEALATLCRFDETLKRYFALYGDDAACDALIAARDKAPLIAHFGSSSGAAIAHVLREDERATSAYYRNGRKASDGFSTLSPELVAALRDGAQLAWGGIDFGADSGNMARFDMRTTGPGRALAQASGTISPIRSDAPRSSKCAMRRENERRAAS